MDQTRRPLEVLETFRLLVGRLDVHDSQEDWRSSMIYSIVTVVDTGDGGYIGARFIADTIEEIMKDSQARLIEPISIFEGELTD